MTDFKDNGSGEGTPARAHSSPSGFGWLTVALSTAGTLLIIAMAVGVNADILGRELINRPVPGVTEFLGLAIVAVVFLQIADTCREERHISNDLIVSWIAGRHPRLAHVVYGMFQLIGAAMFLIIVWFVVPIFIGELPGRLLQGHGGLHPDSGLAVRRHRAGRRRRCRGSIYPAGARGVSPREERARCLRSPSAPSACWRAWC